MSSANAFNLDQSQNLSCGKDLMSIIFLYSDINPLSQIVITPTEKEFEKIVASREIIVTIIFSSSAIFSLLSQTNPKFW